MSSDRPPVPAPVKRQLRQQAGFGCCVCGLPIYQYHHIVPWEIEQHFRLEDMMLLCPNHHDQATKGAMEEAEQRCAQASPHNIARGYAEGLLTVNQRYCAVDVGGGVFLVGEGAWVQVDGERLLTLEASSEGTLLLTATVYDEHDQLLAQIERNEWIAGDPATWDMESDWQRLILRVGPGRVALRINAKRAAMTLRGVLWRRGHRFRFMGGGIEVSGRRSFSNLGLVRMGLKLDSSSAQLTFGPAAGEHGYIVSEPDPIQRLLKSIEAFRGVNLERSPIGRQGAVAER